MSMSRRSFIKATGAVSALLLSGVTASATALSLKNTAIVDTAIDLEQSIQANFGSGFRVLNHTRNGDSVLATIEHLGNRYRVVSTNLNDWQIIASTKM